MSTHQSLLRTRRHFFADCAVGVAKIALASLLGNRAFASSPGNPLGPRAPHFPARAKRVIYLFMAGGPSQFELFDYKPELRRREGQPLPASFLGPRRFAFIPNDAKLLGTRRRFARHGHSGAEISELLPHI